MGEQAAAGTLLDSKPETVSIDLHLENCIWKIEKDIIRKSARDAVSKKRTTSLLVRTFRRDYIRGTRAR